MNDLRKAAEMALEVLLKYDNDHTIQHYVGIKDSIEALRQALTQPEQEPFGYFRYDLEWDGWVETEPDNGKSLYTAPPKREWQGLTVDEVFECWETGDVVAAVEAKLKEKNT